MKIRNGFISNSSSSSFILRFPMDRELNTKEEIKDWFGIINSDGSDFLIDIIMSKDLITPETFEVFLKYIGNLADDRYLFSEVEEDNYKELLKWLWKCIDKIALIEVGNTPMTDSFYYCNDDWCLPEFSGNLFTKNCLVFSNH